MEISGISPLWQAIILSIFLDFFSNICEFDHDFFKKFCIPKWENVRFNSLVMMKIAGEGVSVTKTLTPMEARYLLPAVLIGNSKDGEVSQRDNRLRPPLIQRKFIGFQELRVPTETSNTKSLSILRPFRNT
jgi:hypothetical protein